MEARRLRARFAAEIQIAPPALLELRSTMAEVAADWIGEQRARVGVGELSMRTYEIYEVGLRLHVLPKLGKRPVRSISPDDLVSWIRGMRAAGFAPHTVHNYWAALHLVLRHAVRRGVIGGNPADRLTSAERPKLGASRRRFLSREELERLLAVAPERYRVSIACAMFSGLRLGELLGLTWADVDFARKVLHVQFQMGRDGKRMALKTAAARRDGS
jgi:integrase